MRNATTIRIIIALAATTALSAAVLDRIAVTVGRDAITESEVLEEIRVTNFLNNERLDLSSDARHAAADRLVDQYLIRHELATGSYSPPDPNQAVKLISKLVKERFHSQAAYEQMLKQYGITEEDLKSHLLFQLQALQFTNLRFAEAQPAPAQRNEADRSTPSVSVSVAAPPTDDISSGGDSAANVDQRLEAWLKQVRSQTRIEFKKEAFR